MYTRILLCVFFVVSDVKIPSHVMCFFLFDFLWFRSDKLSIFELIFIIWSCFPVTPLSSFGKECALIHIFMKLSKVRNLLFNCCRWFMSIINIYVKDFVLNKAVSFLIYIFQYLFYLGHSYSTLYDIGFYRCWRSSRCLYLLYSTSFEFLWRVV